MYICFSSRVPHTLYCLVTVLYGKLNVTYGPFNAQGAPSLIGCKRSKLNETNGPYGRCLRFVTAFTVRTDRNEPNIRTRLSGVPAVAYF